MLDRLVQEALVVVQLNVVADHAGGRGMSRLDPSQRCLRGRTGPAGGFLLFTATPLAKAFLRLAAHDLDALLPPRVVTRDDPARRPAALGPAPGPHAPG